MRRALLATVAVLVAGLACDSGPATAPISPADVLAVDHAANSTAAGEAIGSLALSAPLQWNRE